MQTRSLGGASYFLTFIDDRSRYTWVYFIRRKGDVFEYFKEFRTIIEKHTEKCIKILRSDNGGECCCICNFGMYSLVYFMYCTPMFIPGSICNVIESCHASMFLSGD